MKRIDFCVKESCSDALFSYPCVDANSKHLSKRITSIYGEDRIIQNDWIKELGGTIAETEEEKAKAKIAIVCPNKISKLGEDLYYEVLDYYIETLQFLVSNMKSKHNFKHIVVILPSKSDETSTEFDRMAYYAIYGLVKGLGKTYAQYNLYVNGIILNSLDPNLYLKERIQYLISDNSCNTVGQIFKL